MPAPPAGFIGHPATIGGLPRNCKALGGQLTAVFRFIVDQAVEGANRIALAAVWALAPPRFVPLTKAGRVCGAAPGAQPA